MEIGSRGHLSGSFWPAFLLLTFFLSSAYPLGAQETLPSLLVTVSSRNKTIQQVLEEITLQTAYHFTYDASIIDGSQKVQLQVSDLPLETALDSLFRDQQLDYRTIERNIVIYRKNQVAPKPFSPALDRSLLKGRVLDARSGKVLPYATIALLGTSLGSISNQQGEFSFKIPLDLPDPMLVISYMGYGSKMFPVSYPLEDELNIELNKELIPLQEVIIRYSDPAKLLQEAIRRIPGNYLDDHATMTAFYRESVKRNERCMIYSEAVLDVAKAPYASLASSDHIGIVKRRKITDVTAEDTILVKLRSGITTSMSLDVIKNQPDFLSEDFQERYNLEFTDMVSYRDRLVYVVSFQQKREIDQLLFRGQIYLDQETLAVLAVDFEFNPDLLPKEPEIFLVSRSPSIRIRPVKAKYHVDYRSINNQFYVSQVRAELELKARKRKKWISSRYTISIEMAITDLIPNQRLRINPAERVRRNIVLADEPFEFDPEFWGIHNSIEPEASLMESIRKLEHSSQEIQE